MYSSNICLHPGCMKTALSNFDENGEILEANSYCYKHHPAPEDIKAKIYKYIQEHDKIVGLNANGLTFKNIDLTNKRFYGCCFHHCIFAGIRSTGFRSRISSFDYAVFTDCNLIKSNMQYTSFAGAKFIHVLFTGSDMILDNFTGLSSFQSSFDDSDLYSSRFINAKLVDTSIRNCNIRQTIFYNLEQQNVSFRMSNTKEANFDEKGSALFMGDDDYDKSAI